jgi:lipopolysaccharide export system protein LptC
MKDRRASANRLQLWVIAAAVLILMLGSFWLLDVFRRGMEDSTSAAKRTEPDYYVEQFNFVRLAKSGQARYHVSGERLVHYPQNDSFEIRRPIMKGLSDKYPTTTIVADRAVSNSDMSEVQLFSNVKMDRPASPNSQHLQLTSDYVMVLPDDDVMKTNRPVQLILGGHVLTGIGMFANQATGEFKLASQVHGILAPRAPQ